MRHLMTAAAMLAAGTAMAQQPPVPEPPGNLESCRISRRPERPNSP